MSRERLYLDNADAIEESLRFISRRHRCSQDEADDFASWARLKLVENDYAILASFEKHSKIQTFLRIVLQRLFIDYRRGKWGRWRPSEEAKRLGPLAIRLEVLLSRDRMTLDEACQCLCTLDPDLSRRQIEDVFTKLPIRTAQPIEVNDDLLTAHSGGLTPEREILAKETEASWRRATAALPLLLQKLPPQEQIILRLRFAEGMQIVDIAARLHLEAKPLYRRIERLKAELRRELEAGGFDAEGLGWPVAVPAPRQRAGAGGGPPSVRELGPSGRLNDLGEKT